MVVRLDAGREAVRAYVSGEAAKGVEHVRRIVKADFDAMESMIGDLSENEAEYSPGEGEYSVSQVIQHLNTSFDRSAERLATLSSGRAWSAGANAAPAVPGGLPAEAPGSFEVARRQFVEGAAKVMSVLDGTDGRKGLELTASHADLGPFNWLEWAVYSHHVHTSDHLGQVGRLREEIVARRAESTSA